MGRLFFKTLNIRKAPGFRTGINAPELESLSPSVNILTGPNGSGKSTTARIIHQLIWHENTRGCDARGSFEMDGEQWISEVDSAFASYTRDGKEAVPSGLPSSGAQRVYYLALHDLVKAEDGDLAKNILDESIGGFDLEQVQSSLYGSGTRITTRAKDYTEYRDADKKLRDVTEVHRQLKNEEKNLAKLEDSKASAEKASRLKDLFQLAAGYLEAKLTLEDTESKVGAYPEPIQKVTGDEIRIIEECNDEAGKEAQIISDNEREISEKELKLKKLKVPEKGIDDIILAELKRRTDRLTDYERDLRQVKEPAIACQKEAEEGARRKIDLTGETGSFNNPDLQQIGDIDTYFNKSLTTLKLKKLIEAEIGDATRKQAAITKSEIDPATLDEGIRILGNWLKDEKSIRMLFWPLITAGIMSAVLIIMLLAELSNYYILPVAGVIIISSAIAIINIRKANSSLKVRELDYTNTGLKLPGQWESSKVSEKLSELLKESADLRFKEAELIFIETKLNDLKGKKDFLDEEAARLGEDKKKLQDILKAFPEAPCDLSMSELYIFLKNVNEWQSAAIKLGSLVTEKDELEKSWNEELNRCNLIFKDLNAGQASGSIEAKSIFDQLSDHERQRRELSGSIDRLKKSITDSRERIAKIERKTCSLYTRLGIEQGNKDEVAGLVSRLDAYRKDIESKSIAEAGFKQAKRKLHQHPLYVENSAKLENTELSVCLERVQYYEKEAEGLGDISTKITRIKTLIDHKKEGNELEEVLARRNDAVSNLGRLHEQHLSSITGSLLIENIQKETGEMSRPAVFRTADSYFRKITNNKYELRVSAGNMFMAFDTRLNEALDLTKLSTGTRVQLLLSIRLAFIEQQERGVRLPVIADELLANSDNERADAIISALYEISKGGRQVFYLTAQTDEALRWEKFLQQREDKEYVIIPLDGAYKGHHDVRHKPGISKIKLAADIPAPDGMSIDEYRRIVKVPTYDLMSDTSTMLPLGYLTVDTGLLYRCMKHGIETWGQLKSHPYTGLIQGLDDACLEVMKNKIRILEDFQALYRQGRSKRIDMDTLLDSGAVTPNFRDPVKEKLDLAEGDPVRLLNDLPPGFRTKNKEALESYLVNYGYINEGKPLTKEEIKPRILAASAQLKLEAKEAEDFLNSIIARSGNTTTSQPG